MRKGKTFLRRMKNCGTLWKETALECLKILKNNRTD